jgi:hypothetical protein
MFNSLNDYFYSIENVYINNMLLIVRLISESFRFAVVALFVNKVRTFLSLLGITIGIFSIISVFSVFDSLEKAIRVTLTLLATMFYLFKSGHGWRVVLIIHGGNTGSVRKHLLTKCRNSKKEVMLHRPLHLWSEPVEIFFQYFIY